MKRWTPADDDELRRLYPLHGNPEIGHLLGCTEPAVQNRARLLGLRKPEGHINSGRFGPGQKSWNAGKKGWSSGGRSVETRFKPGNRTGRANAIYRPIGTERISKDGYLERKINDDMPLQRRWRGVHLILWEAANGPLPAGHALVFNDGDKTHIALDNLTLVTRAELMARNTVHNLPPAIAELVQLRGALMRKIRHAERNQPMETTAP